MNKHKSFNKECYFKKDGCTSGKQPLYSKFIQKGLDSFYKKEILFCEDCGRILMHYLGNSFLNGILPRNSSDYVHDYYSFTKTDKIAKELLDQVKSKNLQDCYFKEYGCTSGKLGTVITMIEEIHDYDYVHTWRNKVKICEGCANVLVNHYGQYDLANNVLPSDAFEVIRDYYKSKDKKVVSKDDICYFKEDGYCESNMPGTYIKIEEVRDSSGKVQSHNRKICAECYNILEKYYGNKFIYSHVFPGKAFVEIEDYYIKKRQSEIRENHRQQKIRENHLKNNSSKEIYHPKKSKVIKATKIEDFYFIESEVIKQVTKLYSEGMAIEDISNIAEIGIDFVNRVLDQLAPYMTIDFELL